MLLRLPRAALDRVGAGAAAGDARLRVHPVRAGRGGRPRRRPGSRCARPAARSRSSRSCSTPTSTCWRAPPSSPRAPTWSRPPAAWASRAREAILRVARADGAAGDPRRRGAGADGVAGGLRHGEPARRADLHQRHLQGLVRRLRPRRRAAARHDAGVGHAAAARCSSARRAGAPGTPAGGARRAPEPVRLRGRRRRRWRCSARCAARVLVVGGAAWSQLAVWSVESLSDDLLPTDSAWPRATACCWPGCRVLLVVGAALAARLRAAGGGSALGDGAVRVATIGYGLPGLGGGGGRDRAARLDRPPARRRRRAWACCSPAP